MRVYVHKNVVLNKGQSRKIVKFLRNLAETANPVISSCGICINLDKFILGSIIANGTSLGWGYDLVQDLSLGFPDVEMEPCGTVISTYPLGYEEYHLDSLWKVGNRRTKLCTYIADGLQRLIDKA